MRSVAFQACSAGDILIDGGNSYYKDDIRREVTGGEGHPLWIDSGGVWGSNAAMMIGGAK
jgi:6-phosphogluconate dehydrogenase